MELYISTTANNAYSGDRYSGNDGYSGQNPPDDAILFTVSRITAIADKKIGDLDKRANPFWELEYRLSSIF